MIVLTPRVSEKAYKLHGDGTYVFNVSMDANKAGVITAVKEQYGVDAADVRFVVKKGKPVRVNRGKRAYPGNAVRTTTKKAYVRLAGDAKLELFKEESEEK